MGGLKKTWNKYLKPKGSVKSILTGNPLNTVAPGLDLHSIMQRADEKILKTSKVHGRSESMKKDLRRQRRKAVTFADPLGDSNRGAQADFARMRARSGRASTLLSDDDRLGG